MSDVLLEPWSEAIDAFPLSGSPEAKCRAAIEYAIQAPSTHNTQPWLFELREGGVDLYADRSRALSVVDPQHRALVMSCGAALFHLRLALAYFGSATSVTLLPDAEDHNLLARLTLVGNRLPTEEERALFGQIRRRHTYRHGFDPRPVPRTLLSALRAAVVAEGAWLEILESPSDRIALADLIATGDLWQFADRRFRRELAAWCRPNRSRRRDGIPGHGLGLGTFGSLAAPWVIRTLDLGTKRAARDRELALAAPALAVLATRDDSVKELLRAGQALARMLLLACASGVDASFLNQPIELDELRPEVEGLLSAGGRAQLILRLGYGIPTPATPRRPVAEVLIP